MLVQLDREALVIAALQNGNELQRDRERWRYTARALSSMPGTGPEAASVAAGRESALGIASSACRTLVEMAVATCPVNGGGPVGQQTLGTLMAGVALMLELATEADALHDGPPAPGIRLYPNGWVDVEQPWLGDVAAPFVRASFEEGWRADVAGYERRLVERNTRQGTAAADTALDGRSEPDASAASEDPAGSTSRGGPAGAVGVPATESDADPDGTADERGDAAYLADETFADAFREEYGLTPAQMTEAVAECIDWATERGTPVFVVSRAALTARLTTRRALTASDVDALPAAFGLAPRPRWDSTPAGYSGADWYPWRFRRRLSLLARPFVLLDRNVLNRAPAAPGGSPGIVGDVAAPDPSDGAPAATPVDSERVVLDAALLVAGLSYLVSGLRAGWFQQAFVSSRAMKRYLGAAAERLGAAFTERVASVCRAAGWQARTEVNMTQLGARAELGDVDVIAWREGDPRLLCIECMRLRPPATCTRSLRCSLASVGRRRIFWPSTSPASRGSANTGRASPEDSARRWKTVKSPPS